MSTEEIPLVAANDAFKAEERQALADSMSKALDLKFGHSERLEAAVDVSPYLYIVLGYLTWKIIDGILGKIGSDLWDKGKQRFVKTVMQHKSASAKPSRIGFEFDYDTTHVSMSVESNDPSVIGQAFDKIGDVLKDVRQLAKERNLPGTESEIFYVFQGTAWEIDGAVIMKPSFDKVRFDRKVRKWISQDPKAAEDLRKFRANER